MLRGMALHQSGGSVRGWVGVPEFAAAVGIPERTARRLVSELADIHPEHIVLAPRRRLRRRYRIDLRGLVSALELERVR